MNDVPGTPAPKRTARRAGNQSMPAVAIGRSTAYGDNTIAEPARQATYTVQDDVADILNKLAGPKPSTLNQFIESKETY